MPFCSIVGIFLYLHLFVIFDKQYRKVFIKLFCFTFFFKRFLDNFFSLQLKNFSTLIYTIMLYFFSKNISYYKKWVVSMLILPDKTCIYIVSDTFHLQNLISHMELYITNTWSSDWGKGSNKLFLFRHTRNWLDPHQKGGRTLLAEWSKLFIYYITSM